MATEGGEKELLKLASPVRKHTFARMVSWEFSKPIEPKAKRRSKKQRREDKAKTAADCDEIDDTMDTEEDEDSCESEEYVTADEEYIESTEDEIDFEKLNIRETPLPPQEHHGARSKCQKKRRRRIFRQKELDFFAPFVNEEENEIEPVTSGDTHVNKNVPSLMEICLRACQQTNKANSPLPITKHSKDVLRDRQTFHSLQLKWLHRNMGINEKDFCGKEIFSYFANERFITEDVVQRIHNSSEPIGNVNRETIRSLPVKYGSYGETNYWHLVALVHTIDLMLPVSFKHATCSSIDISDDVAITRARQTAVIKVKIALKARYPKLVEHLFDTALAYVWWGRGQLPQASQMLYQAAKNIDPLSAEMKKMKSFEPYLLKAMYLNEAGLMYSMFGDPRAAAKCYHQAADVSCSTQEWESQEWLVLQSLILTAAAWDQGLMDKKSAVNSCSGWNAVTASPKDCPLEVACAALDAFLCFHAGMSTDRCIKSPEDEIRAWLYEAKAKLENLLKSPSMNLYYAFVLAMLGLESESLHALRIYAASCDASNHPHGFPARQIRNSTRSSVLQPLIEVSRTQTMCFPVLSMVWRRQCSYPIISKRNSIYYICVNVLADRQGEPLNLHINDEGYLTGDLYLNLPSMRGLHLDPYNGSVCIVHTPSISEPWQQSLYKQYGVEELLPMPYCIYSDTIRHVSANLVTVQQLESNCYFNQSFYVQWKSPEHFHHLNLRKIIRQRLKEHILKQARECYDNGELTLKKIECDESKKRDHLVISSFEEKKKKFDEHYERGWDFSYSHIFQDYPCSCGERIKAKLKKHSVKAKFDIRLNNVARYGKATVLLMLNVSHKNWLPNTDTLVFLDMSSFEAFCKPVIHFVEHGKGTSRVFQPTTIPSIVYGGPSHQDVDVIGLTTPDGLKTVVTAFDEFGTVVNTSSEPRNADNACILTHGIGSSLFGLVIDNNNEEMGRIKALDVKKRMRWESINLFQPKEMVVGHNTVFVRTETALVLLDAPTLLPIDVNFSNAEDEVLDGQWLNKELQAINVLASNKITRLDLLGKEVELYRIIFTADTKVYLLDRPCQNSDAGPSQLNVVTEVDVGGVVTEACYISEEVGFVVTVTLNEKEDSCYREHLYWYSNQGDLRGFLPFLGKGPHDFYSVHLYGKDTDTETQTDTQTDTQGWYLYFTDGHGAICCTKLM